MDVEPGHLLGQGLGDDEYLDVEAVEDAAVDGVEGAARDEASDDEPSGVGLPVLARARWRSSCSSRVLRSIWSARTPRTTTSNI